MIASFIDDQYELNIVPFLIMERTIKNIGSEDKTIRN